jgi:hypothetical protein
MFENDFLSAAGFHSFIKTRFCIYCKIFIEVGNREKIRTSFFQFFHTFSDFSIDWDFMLS